MITEILNNPRSEFFFSFLIGIGLMIMLFHRPVLSEKTLAVHPSELDNRSVKSNGKCYTYRVEDSMCEILSSK